jgi:hypothetical protein
MGCGRFGMQSGPTTLGGGKPITVTVKQPEVQHTVRVKDFEAWLQSGGRSPVEMSLKIRLRELLKK